MAQLVLSPRQRSHIGAGPRAGFRQKTLGHVPGSVLRGAFAAAWLARNAAVTSANRDEFVALFEGEVIYGPLFASHPTSPLSVLIHKYPARDSCARTYWDEATFDDQVPTSCPDCASPLQRSKPGDPMPGTAATPRRTPDKISRTHVEIGKDGVAADGILYMREELSTKDTRFVGQIHGPSSLLATLGTFDLLRIGGRRTTSGAMDVQLRPMPYEPPALADGGRLVLRLVSPGIFVDERGAAAPEPSSTDLERVLGVPASVERRWIRWTEVGGWHAASNLPKPVEQAVDVGSTYLVSVEHQLAPAATANLARGIGLRRHEGFGAVGGPESDPAGWVA